MAEPKSKLSRRVRGNRRSHDHLAQPGVSKCANCGSWMKPHNACASCGYYNGREVIAPKE